MVAMDDDLAKVVDAVRHLTNALHNAGVREGKFVIVIERDDFKQLVMHLTHREITSPQLIKDTEFQLANGSYGTSINGVRIIGL